MNGLDGITDAHRGAWDRLSRLHVASTSLPDRTTYLHDDDAPSAA
jgi:hypothetical protein